MKFAEAKAFIDRYFEIRPKLKHYIELQRKLALEQGYVETIMGRRRPTPDVKSSNFAVREGAYRAAVNMPLQGSAADIMKLAMINVAKLLPKGANMLLQIHDSILVECPAGEAESVGKILKETMETNYTDLPVKFKADISSGKNWGEL
jgi:DNA polymerase-1